MSLAIIHQICLANESMGNGTIVVLARSPKEAMEESLAHAMTGTDASALRLRGTEVGIPC